MPLKKPNLPATTGLSNVFLDGGKELRYSLPVFGGFLTKELRKNLSRQLRLSCKNPNPGVFHQLAEPALPWSPAIGPDLPPPGDDDAVPASVHLILAVPDSSLSRQAVVSTAWKCVEGLGSMRLNSVVRTSEGAAT
jgi:hypothetical protein